MASRFVLALGLMLAVSTAPNAQTRIPDSTIQFGGFDLTLGMSQEAVLRKLSSIYTVSASDDVRGQWLVMQRQPTEFIGHIAFRNEKLTFVSKGWLDGPNSGKVDVSAVGDALHKAVQSATGQGGFCIVNSDTSQSGDTQTNIRCGHHTVVISVSHANVPSTGGSISFITVNETLE